MNRSRLITAFKLVISAALIGALVYGVDWQKLAELTTRLEAPIVVLAFMLMMAQFPISVVKWQAALKIHQLQYGFVFLQKVLCIGFFFNNFLPSTIGGDGFRVYKTMPDEGYKSRALSAVLLERIIGFSALLFLGLIGGAFVYQDGSSSSHLALYYIVLVGSGFVFGGLFLLLHNVGVFNVVWERLSKIKKLDLIIHNLTHINRNFPLLAYVTMISLVFQVTAILVTQLLFAAIDVEISLAQAAFLTAIIGMVAILPISINGIGVVEGSFVVAALQLNIAYDHAVVVAFMLRILVVPLSIICGLVYLLTKNDQALAAESES